LNLAEQELDTFADTTPIELDEANGEPVKPDNPEDDTFDNGYYENETKESKDSQVENLEEQDDNDKAPEKKEEEPKKEEEKKAEDKPEDKVEEKPKEEEKPKGKTLKLKSGDDVTDISEDATIKVKVNGKNEFVSLTELKSNYSGEKAWSDKIAAANQKTEEAEARENVFKQEKQQVVGHLEKIATMLDDENGDPLAALNYLVDFTGRDVNLFNKRVMSHMEARVAELSEMDEVEKELYWNKQELSSLKSNQAAKADELKNSEAQREAVAKVDKLRESQGVTEQQYVQAHKEMIDAGRKDLTPEQVVKYAVMTPFISKSLDLTEQYEEILGDSDMDKLVSDVAITLKTYPNLSEQDVVMDSAKRLGISIRTPEDDDIDAINSKIGKKKVVKNDPTLRAGGALKEGELDMFDD